MLLTITYTGQDTSKLGYLLYKNPYRPQVFELNHGKAYVFYPEVSDQRTTAALLLDIDPLDLARRKPGAGADGLFDYVNDRPYVSSSFLSTAIARVFGTAMTGRADSYQALSDSALDLTAAIAMLPCRGEHAMLNRVFEPLGYAVQYDAFATDELFPAWGESAYVALRIRGQVRLRDLLRHIYVLIPVFDRRKHYWVNEDEVEKLLKKGEDWLPQHPEKKYITRSYLKHQRSLISMAFTRLTSADADAEAGLPAGEAAEEAAEKKLPLNRQRLGSVVAALKSCNAQSVIDLGCGEGNLLRLLVKERQFTRISGMDVSHVALARAREKLKLDQAGDSAQERLTLFQGALTYKDSRLAGYDAACLVEVIEHLDPPRLASLERVLFACARPSVLVVSTPNRDYNSKYAQLPESALRHSDHRFEFTRAEFRTWATNVAARHGYGIRFSDIGEADEAFGAPTQMGVFTLCA
jgi:3' terminal RNA ribose 2'-O-methyltransferase Hen1